VFIVFSLAVITAGHDMDHSDAAQMQVNSEENQKANGGTR
jgi:hypothetical protein